MSGDKSQTTAGYQNVRSGDTVIWTDRAGQHVGTAVADHEWEGGLRIGGRSVKNVWEDATAFKVVRQ